MIKQLGQYIQDLQAADEQLCAAIQQRKGLEPEFQISCDYQYVFDVVGNCLFKSAFAKALDNKWLTPNLINRGIQSALRKGRTTIGKEVLDEESGIMCFFQAIFSPFLNDNGTREGVICQVRQSAEHSPKEIRRADYADNIDWLLDVTPAAICIIDKQGVFVNGNQPFLSLFPDMTKQALVGKDSEFFRKYTGLDWSHTPCYQALQGEYMDNCYANFFGRDLVINAAPIKDEAGQIIAAVAAFVDITQYENMRKELVRLDRLNLIGEMAAGVAHEIRNPLTVIKGFLQYIQRKVQEDIAGKIAVALQEIKSIEVLIADFLSLARNKQTQLKKQNINEIIRSMYPLMYTNALKHDVSIDLMLDQKVTECWLDDEEMRQLILNLVWNSIEATRGRSGKVEIRTEQKDKYVLMIVSDEGCGIPQHLLQTIFTPFFTTKDTGTGLGLAICASIVERHKGHIEVQSRENSGTCFSIRLPN